MYLSDMRRRLLQDDQQSVQDAIDNEPETEPPVRDSEGTEELGANEDAYDAQGNVKNKCITPAIQQVRAKPTTSFFNISLMIGCAYAVILVVWPGPISPPLG